MNKITNPILKGFNPDPSIIRVGDDYYIATSTFEWFPGVQIHHSRDLMHWKLVGRPLNKRSQLDMEGEPDSCGVWAPCLSYCDGMFYLVFTDVKGGSGGYFDAHNYLVVSKDITGEWSEPVFINSNGFDPSLFHDDDGKKWILMESCDNGWKKNWFGGIILQEYSSEQQKLIGPVYNIFEGSKLGCTEGPHLYRKHGYYYLITAEGGTGLHHAVTVARAKNIFGPYEIDPEGHILTAVDHPMLPIQKTGHADIVETPEGETYMVHLCGRPIPSRGVCTLGRETCIQKVEWTESKWLRLEDGSNKPSLNIQIDIQEEYQEIDEPTKDDFDSPKLNIHFQSLRIPLTEDRFSLTERPGYLRLKGRESLSSRFKQSLVARRQQSFCYTATTCVEFEPQSFKQMAGLVCYYNTQNYHYLYITKEETLGKCLYIKTCNNGNGDFPLENAISVEGWNRCYLKVEVAYDRLRFYYSKDGEAWNRIASTLDAAILSDENCKSWWGFTGAFVGICCQDMTGQRIHADFDYFEYIETEV